MAAERCRTSPAREREGVLQPNFSLFSQPSGSPPFVFILTERAQTNPAELRGSGLAAVTQRGEEDAGWSRSSASGCCAGLWRLRGEMVGAWWVPTAMRTCLYACSRSEARCFCPGRCSQSREGRGEGVLQHGVRGPSRKGREGSQRREWPGSRHAPAAAGGSAFCRERSPAQRLVCPAGSLRKEHPWRFTVSLTRWGLGFMWLLV